MRTRTGGGGVVVVASDWIHHLHLVIVKSPGEGDPLSLLSLLPSVTLFCGPRNQDRERERGKGEREGGERRRERDVVVRTTAVSPNLL